ncbi:hypothetical protein BTJ39_22450 [Izhakiella australiensis]|uniref:DUF3024 domain-containing protein n=1 Tax=Izhakiella australiensis TaxID=1926881 RepID=A0A1S8Y9Y1_9GAMM|nr:DUF3024 domain-containing protein [Izhakiella australiensis]OON35637.1 hypothetical protein BTJ39_22450 [Izhakiella australiensis]
MAFNDIEYHAVLKEVEQFVESIRPPVHARNEFDIVFCIKDQTIEIAEERPVWQGKPGEKCLILSARISYVRSQKVWRLFWMRGNMKWELYEEIPTLEAALNAIRADTHGCFFG